ncbi:hypothetical protein Bca101_026809 [Brassica carinata]
MFQYGSSDHLCVKSNQFLKPPRRRTQANHFFTPPYRPSTAQLPANRADTRSPTVAKDENPSLHGFPTIILLNSTMRVAYRGSRTLDSLVAFYTDASNRWLKVHLRKNRHVPHFGDQNNTEPENGPVSWVRRRSPPENLFCQETYLTLATVFVLLRLVHLIFPALVMFVKFTWGRVAQNMRSGSLLEHSVTMYLREPSMSSNLEEGTMSATAWASKSLATVSIGDSSSLRRSFSTSQ